MLTTDDLVAIAYAAQAPTDDAGRPIPMETRPVWMLDELARIAHAVRAATLEEAARIVLAINPDFCDSGYGPSTQDCADELRSEAAKLKG